MLRRTLYAIAPIIMLGCGGEARPAHPSQQQSPPSPPPAPPAARSDSVLAVAFCDTLVSGLDTNRLTNPRNQSDRGHWQVQSVLMFVSDSGLSVHDSTADTTWSVTKAELAAEIGARHGPTQRMLVGLAYAVAQEHPRYEPIIIRRLAHSTVVYVTGWDGFRITLVPEAGTMRVRRIEFVEADAE